MDSTQDRAVVLAVVILLGGIGVVGLAGVVWLVHDHVDPAAVAVVTALVGPAIGALAALLASTRTAQPVLAQAQQVGYTQAVADVAALASLPPGPASVTSAPPEQGI